MTSTTGGMTTTTGESVLVTSSGTIVGSAYIPRRRRGGGGNSSPAPQPTGGMTTTTGESVLVTPSGTVVGSAVTPTRTVVGSAVTPTRTPPTQQELRSSTLPDRISGEVVRRYDKPTRETYNPKTGQYETASISSGGQGTIEITKTRLPTTKEQVKIDVMEGSPLFASTEKLKVDIEEAKRNTGKVNALGAEISFVDEKIADSLKGKTNEKGEFIGTEQEYKKYSELVKRRNQVYDKYETASMKLKAGDRTLDFSFFGEKIPVKVSELSRKGVGLSIVSKYGEIVPTQAAKGLGKATADVSGVASKYFIRSPQAIIDVKTGVYRPTTKADVLAQREYAKEKIEKGVSKVFTPIFKTGTYLVPYAGAGLFAAQVGEELSRYDYKPVEYIKAKPVEAALVIGGGLLVGGIVARSLVKSSKIKTAVLKDLKLLEETPLRSVTIYEEATGKIVAEGVKKTATGYQKVKITGEIKKTEKGFKFIPKGKETSEIVGKVTPEAKTVKFEVMKSVKGEPRLDVSIGKKKLKEEAQLYFSGQAFEVGAKGTMVPRGTIGELKFYESVGVGTAVPKKNVFGMVAVPETRAEAFGALKQLKSQLKKRRELPPIEKEVKLPTGKADYVQVKDVLGIKYSPEEVGVIIKIPKPKAAEESIGFQGGAKKSSQEYLQSMWAPQELKEIQKVVTMKAEEVAGRGLEVAKKTVKIEQETLSGLPVGGSQFVGTGQYETIQTVSPTFLEVRTQPVSVDVASRVGSGVGRVSVLKEKAKTKLEQPQALKLFQEMKVLQKQQPEIKSKLRIKERLILRGEQIQRQKEELLARQIQKVQPKLKIVPRLKTPIKVKVPIPETGLLGRLSKIAEKEGGFEIFQKIKGKEVKTGEAISFGAAAKELGKGLKSGLQASGFLVSKRTGKKVKAKRIVPLLGEEFRPSRVSMFGVVEKKGKRLRKGGTGKQIQLFR